MGPTELQKSILWHLKPAIVISQCNFTQSFGHEFTHAICAITRAGKFKRVILNERNRNQPCEQRVRWNHLLFPFFFFSFIRLPKTTFCSAAAFTLALNCSFNVGGFGLAAGGGFDVLPPLGIGAALGATLGGDTGWYGFEVVDVVV